MSCGGAGPDGGRSKPGVKELRQGGQCYSWLVELALALRSRHGRPLHTMPGTSSRTSVAHTSAHGNKGTRGPRVPRHHTPSRGSRANDLKPCSSWVEGHMSLGL